MFWSDDKWLSNMQHGVQIVAVNSWGDVASRLVFAFGLLQCMDAMKELLTPAPMHLSQVFEAQASYACLPFTHRQNLIQAKVLCHPRVVVRHCPSLVISFEGRTFHTMKGDHGMQRKHHRVGIGQCADCHGSQLHARHLTDLYEISLHPRSH